MGVGRRWKRVVNYFKYKLLEPTGNIASGVIRLPYKDIFSAISCLERGDNTTIYVKKLNPLTGFLFQLFTLRIRGKITRPFQAEFLHNVSLMMRAGISLTAALKEAAGSSGRPDFEADIQDMIRNIHGGAGFSETAKNYPYIFPRTVVHLIRLGEDTGKLDNMLADASDHLTRIQKIITDTKQALLYPCFVLLSMGAGLLFWFYYVVPKIVGLFKDMDVELPQLTIIILRISNYVQDHFLGIIFGMAATILTVVLSYKSNRKIRKAADTLLLNLPLSRTIVSASVIASITEHFSLLLNVGIDIARSIDILKDSTTNEVYRDKLVEVRESLNRGEGVADSFMRAHIFPPFVVRMINVGEQSGTLPEQLNHIAGDYRNRLSVLVATIGKIIEPAVLVIAGIMFAIIIGGLFLPVYDLVSTLGGR
jgi:general secretion pathway protein F/type IV pilus assembly protein PilC